MRAAGVALFFLFLLITSCRPGSSPQEEVLDYLPEEVSMIVKIKDPDRLRSDYRNCDLTASSFAGAKENALRTALERILDLNVSGEGFLMMTTKPEDWLYIFKDNATAQALTGPATDKQTADASTENLKWKLPDSSKLASRKTDRYQIIASSERLLHSSGDIPEALKSGLRRALQTTNPYASASLILPESGMHPSQWILTENLAPLTSLDAGKWAAYDLHMAYDSFRLQGTETQPDSLLNNRSLIKNIPVLPLLEVARIAPTNTTGIYSYSLADPTRFLANQNVLLARKNTHANIVESTEHLSLFEISNETLFAVKSVNTDLMEEALRPFKGEVSSFQGSSITSLKDAGLLQQAFEPLLNKIDPPNFYCNLENYFIFSKNLEAIQGLISAYSRKDTYAYQESFENISQSLPTEASALAIVTKPGEAKLLKDPATIFSLPANIMASLPNDYLYLAEINAASEYSLLSYQLRGKPTAEAEKQAVELQFTRQLEAGISWGPQFLKNHLTGRMDIAVQDENNRLYLYSDRGNRYWEKELNGRIRGKISQVDLFKNGKLQMAFSTSSELMVLDRNGEEVAPFPKSFPGSNLSELAVFDYETNRNYRMVLCQGSKVFMFDGQGREVRGFKFREAESPVKGTPNHIRIGVKDYLIFKLENGQLKILNRVGDTRVKVTDRFDFSDNPVYLYKNTFAFTEADGMLVTIDPRGKVGRIPLRLNKDHGIDATTKTLAVMNDNELRIKGKSAELDLGVYTHPGIFYLHDIIYVAVTDIQSQRVFLFRSDASPLKGFPVEGNGLADMADTDNDRNPELTVQYRDSAFALYRIRR
ncbi:hypothetical protein [Robiginitalea sp. IMCC43444]|uniref:hypothetical protein n=1 Tax=Robiginitalea sp. IMCC43444 TaxID=3459121 RepID=UPI0040426B14